MNGTAFEDKTSLTFQMLELGYVPNANLGLKSSDETCFYAEQNAAERLFYKIANSKLWTRPDVLYLAKTESGYTLKIIEMKFQRVPGSVDEKLKCAPYLVKEYQEMCKGTVVNQVELAYCISDYLKQHFFYAETAKARFWLRVYQENGIRLFFGDEPDYKPNVLEWFKSV